MKNIIKNYKSSMTVMSILLLPGCGGNLINWGKKTFVQAKKQKNISKNVKTYAKEINIYDQLNTIALFDVLWLSDQVRMFYADMYAMMTGKDDEEKKVMLRRLFKANSTYISFYVLTPVSIVLAVKPIEWGISMEVDGIKYQPIYIKKCEIPFQYHTLFGKRFNLYKQSYEVKFDRYDTNGNDILSSDSEHTIKFFITSPLHIGSAQWNVSNMHDDLIVQFHKDTSLQGEETFIE